MTRLRNWFWLAMTALVLWLSPNNAVGQFGRIQEICFDDLLIVAEDILVREEERMPIGCELIDCCPGCPLPDFLDLRIQLTSDLLESILLDFENLPTEVVNRLNIKGNAKWLENNLLQIGRGETILSGFPVDPKRPLAVVSPRLGLDKAGVQKYLDKAGKGLEKYQNKMGSMQFAMEQMLGEVVVNEYTLHYIFNRCRVRYLENDEIILNNNIGNDNAIILLDGHREDCLNDEIVRTNHRVHIGNLVPNEDCNSEVAIFSDDNAMEFLTDVDVWTEERGDRLEVELRPLLEVPVTVWILERPFNQEKAQLGLASANRIFNTRNYCGISFTTTAIHDATEDEDAEELLSAGCAQARDLRERIGFREGDLNLYYLGVRRYDPLHDEPIPEEIYDADYDFWERISVRTVYCEDGPTLIIYGFPKIGAEAHLFGHAFSLQHLDFPGFPGGGPYLTRNTMETGDWPGRNELTLGQCFRCNVNESSFLNTQGIRRGPTRDCSHEQADELCPDIDLDRLPR